MRFLKNLVGMQKADAISMIENAGFAVHVAMEDGQTHQKSIEGTTIDIALENGVVIDAKLVK